MNGPATTRAAADVDLAPDGSSAAGSVNRSGAATDTNPPAGAPARPTSHAAAAPPPSDDRDEWEQAQLVVAAHRICPGCGTTMVDRSCKLRCLRCGFFLDCSDG